MPARTRDHSIAVTAATAATATASTMTEVSIRWPSHVMATSPGRSASQTAPNANSPITRRKMTTRIIMPRWIDRPRGWETRPRSFAQTRESIRGEPPARFDGSKTALHFLDPSVGRRAGSRRQALQLDQCAGEIAPGDLNLDTRHNGRRVTALRLLQRTNAHELLGVCLQLFEQAACTYGWSSSCKERGNEGRELPGK